MFKNKGRESIKIENNHVVHRFDSSNGLWRAACLFVFLSVIAIDINSMFDEQRRSVLTLETIGYLTLALINIQFIKHQFEKAVPNQSYLNEPEQSIPTLENQNKLIKDYELIAKFLCENHVGLEFLILSLAPIIANFVFYKDLADNLTNISLLIGAITVAISLESPQNLLTLVNNNLRVLK